MSDLQHDVTRCLALLAIARKFPGITVAELARRAQLTETEVREDLFSTLLMCGVPPYFPHDYVSCTLEGDRVTVYFADQFKRPVSLTALEALSLKIVLGSLAPPGEGPPPAAVRLLAKIERAMAPKQRARFRTLAKSVAADVGRTADQTLTRRLTIFKDERREVEVDYFAPGSDQVARYVIHPLGLFARNGRWYLAAFDPVKGFVVSLRVDRILSVQETNRRFKPPAGFDLTTYLAEPGIPAGEGLARARVSFYGSSARWIREIADSGTLREIKDGVEWTTQFAKARAFAAFLLGLGAEFVVHEPEELRLAVLGALQATHDAHAREA